LLLERWNKDDAKRALSDKDKIYQQVVELLTKVLKVDSKDIEAHQKLCDVILRRKTYKKAYAACAHAARLDPYHFRTQYYRGTTLRLLEKYHEAVESFEIAATLEPKNPSAQFFYGQSLARSGGDINLAIEAYNRSLQLQDNDGRVHAHMGVALAEVDRNEEAIDHLEKAILRDPETYRHKYNQLIRDLTKIVIAERELDGFDEDELIEFEANLKEKSESPVGGVSDESPDGEHTDESLDDEQGLVQDETADEL